MGISRIVNTKLCKLAYQYGVDKCPGIKHNYTPFYFDLLNKQADSFKKILEIGIGFEATMSHVVKVRGNYKKGASLYMWRDFFPNAKIFGADIRSDLMFTDNRITTFTCDQTSKADLERLILKIGTDIDLVIDDGSHKWQDQVLTCQFLLSILKNDVIYIIEDVRYPELVLNGLREFNCSVPIFERKFKDDRLIIVRKK